MAKRDCSVKTEAAKEEAQKTRRYSVGYLPNRGKPNPNPQLTFSGKWLSELGFEVGESLYPHSPSRTVGYPVGEGEVKLL